MEDKKAGGTQNYERRRTLERLTQLMGVSGFEKEVREAIEKEVIPYADEVLTDAIGNLIVLKRGKGGEGAKKIMFGSPYG